MSAPFLVDIEPVSESADITVLRPQEREVYQSFQVPKRSREWLAGRLAAKRAARRRFAEQRIGVSENQILIEANADGVPSARVGKHGLRLSITHCGALAAAAVPGKAERLGIDVETIEPRDPAWTRLSFHEEEQAAGLSDAGLTTLWTLKEAALKLLELGLSTDLWNVRFLPDDNAAVLGALGRRRLELHNQAKDAWTKMGQPTISFHTENVQSNIILSVAYTYGRTND